MSSEINNLPSSIQQLVVPECIGAHNNTAPSLPNVFGSIVVDPATIGSLYFNTGFQWKNVAASNPAGVSGTGGSVTNDIATFADTTGYVIKDSGMQITSSKRTGITLTGIGAADMTGCVL